MLHEDFQHVRHWVFDLDNTLYPPEVRLFDQIEQKMTAYVMEELGVSRAEADRLRSEYWAEYGTTLAGLMQRHQIDPEPYLVAVHDISFEALEEDALLVERISALPGRRIVYTNGSAPYARNVLSKRGLLDAFDAVYGVEHASYRPKPERAAFEEVFTRDGIDTTTAAMFEDEPRNLLAPYEMGMQTIHVAPERAEGDHIRHHTSNLTEFLKPLV